MGGARYDLFLPLWFNFDALQFVSAVTNAHDRVEVGRNLQIQTEEVQTIKCELTSEARQALGAGEQENIAFVDMPAFLTEPKASKKAESKMTAWLKKLGYNFLRLMDVTTKTFFVQIQVCSCWGDLPAQM